MAEWLAPLADFHFLRPLWLVALAPLGILLWLVHRRRARGGAWHRVIAPALLPLLVRSGPHQAAALPRTSILVLASLLACFALAGPTWERIPLPASKRDSALVILFDLSPSMLAEDLKPNRLTRARLKAIDLLNQHREGSVGLVAWAGDAHVVAPLTDDPDTLIALLPVLQPDIMPQAGSNPELALERGLELAMNAGHLAGDILFITDGFTQQALENINATLRSFPDFRLSILGVGSDEGAPIPLGGTAFGEGGFARDSRGAIVVAGLGSDGLRGIAERHGGRYASLRADDRDIHYLLPPLAAGHGDRTRSLERNIDTWHDRGAWLVLPLLPLMILAFRRGVFALVLLAPLLQVPESRASTWDTLWLNRDQRGHEALENHDPASARELFRDPLWQGIAAYRAGDFAAAEALFARDDSARGHYNRGNALARQGKLDDAADAYRRALSLEPGHPDAKANLAMVEALQRQQQDREQAKRDGADADREGGQGAPDQAPGETSRGQGEQDANPGGSNSESAPGPDGNSERRGEEDGARQQAPRDRDGSDDVGQQGDDGAVARSAGETGDGQIPDEMAPQPDPESTGSSGDEHADQGANLSAAPEAPPGGDSPAPKARPSGATDGTDRDTRDPALEQWLRRVPDDPGGLLRRKFEFQARQNALEQRQSRNLPPDSYQEERW